MAASGTVFGNQRNHSGHATRGCGHHVTEQGRHWNKGSGIGEAIQWVQASCYIPLVIQPKSSSTRTRCTGSIVYYLHDSASAKPR
jgi:hypothetical protein